MGGFSLESDIIRVCVDLGCGEGELAEKLASNPDVSEFRIFKNVISYDLVALKSHITVCDVASLPLAANSVGCAVFSLSLMGTNYRDFIVEAFRVLQIGGSLIIAEILSRFSDVKDFVAVVCNFGAKVRLEKDIDGYFYLLVFEKTADKNLKGVNQKVAWDVLLKPCLYKKR